MEMIQKWACLVVILSSLLVSAVNGSSEIGLRKLLQASNACFGSCCTNGATCCLDGYGSYTCQCSRGYIGKCCETTRDVCANNCCRNGGNCYPGIDSYTCQCANGYAGTCCETYIGNPQPSICASNPCLNGGNCFPVGNGNSFACSCAPGWIDPRCATRNIGGSPNPCASCPCLNGGTCTSTNSYSFQCTCTPQWAGTRCENAVSSPTTGVCTPQQQAYCQHGSSCYLFRQSFACMCAAGWTGLYCEIQMTICAIVPCRNGGTCVEPVSPSKVYTCKCASGFIGSTCEKPSCLTLPCQNGGKCVPKEATNVCQCTSGFSGDQCETSDGGCFPSDSRVTLSDGSTLTMLQLKIGDEVLTRNELDGAVKISPVIAFFDRQPTVKSEYFRISTADNTTISLTALHLIAVVQGDLSGFVHAQRVRLGDEILVHRNGAFIRQQVVTVHREVSVGAFAPLTMTGSVVVDGVVASCYAVVNDHNLGHLSLTPLRWWFSLKELFQVVPEDLSNGVHPYAEWLYPIAKNLNLVALPSHP